MDYKQAYNNWRDATTEKNLKIFQELAAANVNKSATDILPEAFIAINKDSHPKKLNRWERAKYIKAINYCKDLKANKKC